jgi:hypothetical protein
VRGLSQPVTYPELDVITLRLYRHEHLFNRYGWIVASGSGVKEHRAKNFLLGISFSI